MLTSWQHLGASQLGHLCCYLGVDVCEPGLLLSTHVLVAPVHHHAVRARSLNRRDGGVVLGLGSTPQVARLHSAQRTARASAAPSLTLTPRAIAAASIGAPSGQQNTHARTHAQTYRKHSAPA